MSELRGLEQQLVNLKDQCWNLEQKISYLCECLGGVQTALERGGDECPKCAEAHKIFEHPKPAPATVERYTAYRFTEQSTGATFYDTWKRKPIGTVVATEMVGLWNIQFPDGFTTYYRPEQYRALIDTMLKSGVWERQV